MLIKERTSCLEKAINQLPKALKGSIDPDAISLALDNYEFAIIEISQCYDQKKKEIAPPAVRRLVERADTYVEYAPLLDGVRIIGWATGKTADLTVYGPDDTGIWIYRNSDRWVDISGIVIVDKPLRFIDDVVDDLLDEMKPSLCELR
jgi:hypothetical protein